MLTCRKYLTETLKKSGIKTRILTSEKELFSTNESHIGAVITEKDNLKKSGEKRKFHTAEGSFLRRKKFDRIISFKVIIGDYTDERCEEIFKNFLQNLDDGIYIDGNYTEIDIGEAEWADKEDSILKSKLAVNFEVSFNSGIYSDCKNKKVKEVNVSVEMED